MSRVTDWHEANFAVRPAVRARHAVERLVRRPDTLPSQWGWLPGLSAVAALGLLTVSMANRLSSAGYQGVEPLFWLGLVVIVGPITARLLVSRVARSERLGLVIVAGLGLYLVKFLQSPFAFTYSDEFIHLYNADQIAQTGRLFSQNPLLPATALYPGLESATAAIMRLAGLDGFSAGLIVVGLARLIMVLALFLLFEQVGRSARVASLASLLYMANANFLFWSAQYSYESLALPLAVLVLFAVVRRDAARLPAERLSLTVVALLMTCAVVVSHHLSSYFLAAALLLWALLFWGQRQAAFRRATIWLSRVTASVAWQRLAAPVSWFMGRPARRPAGLSSAGEGPGGLAIFALVAALFWLFFVASYTLQYLSPVFARALSSVTQTISGEDTARTLFQSSSGYVAPVLERVLGLSSVLLCGLGLPFGLRQVWRRYLHNPVALLLVAAAIGYFATLGLRFVPAAWEIGNRASEFLFIGLAFVLATSRLPRGLGLRQLMRPILAAAILVIFVGGVISGWQPQLRLAQVYEVAVGNVRLEPAGAAAARWTLATLGPGHHFATDESNGRYLLAYGEQDVLAGRDRSIKSLFEATKVQDWQLQILQDVPIEYLAVDRRLVSADNMAGYFFDSGNQWPLPPYQLLPPSNYTKFEQLGQVSRIFDAGDLVIYDVRKLLSGTPQP